MWLTLMTRRVSVPAVGPEPGEPDTSPDPEKVVPSMADKTLNKKVPEFLREPLEAAQARLVEFEEEAQKVFKDLMQKGKESRKDFGDLVQRLSKQDWKMEELRGRVSKLREQSLERANVLKGRAE